MALVLVAASCGVGQQPSQGGGGGGGPKKICMMPKLVGIPYFNASEKGAEEAAKDLDVELVYDGPTEAKAALQSQMIEQWIQQQCGAISVAANDPDALAPAMKKAEDAGIKTSSWDADVAKDAREVFVNQATFEAIGYELVDVMAEQTDGKGKFLVVTGSLTAPNQVAWLKEMRERMKEKYPEMSIASVEPGEEDLQLGIDITKNYLRANPDTAGVFGITSVALPGAAEAVEQEGLEGEVAVTGLSTPNDMKPYLESGAVEKFVLWNPVDLGYLAVHVANAQIEGNMPKSGTFEAGRLGKVEMIAEDEVLLGPPLVFSQDNIDEYDF
ncbi:substrate-binding domain-containing protein [Rubrobacter tropicus]|uniref:Autoinducer 2-binding protein LsrB n=2 Tax=Rubrobacter tropicus TaxID=2653851 RepID=A0A6G8QF14_9ACTN|nr:substrate-binding domain-containing protein [Rubrobacter tropicus]